VSRDLEDAEILSVVNEEDLVIGQRRRDEIHSLNLFHRSIHVLVFNSNGEIFLQQRGLLKQESPGLWASSVSGHVDAGESYDVACIREIEEEIGIKINYIPKKLFKLKPSKLTANEFSWVYYLETDQLLNPNLSEIEMGKWFSKENLDYFILNNQDKVADLFIHIWRKYCDL
jgi:isopentenyl-diphosphate delta-isomerase|tara:strand:+ start:342 stop:857 length:516 start_codon:yes stop_codon:yes gene_type:complete